jgi:CRP-like cAMP-binding protein
MRRTSRNRKYVDQLRAVELFSACSDHELRVIASLCTPLEVDAGRVLTTEGVRGYECFVVLHGQAVVERGGSIIANVVDGSIIGELAMFGDGIRTATVTAATPMSLLAMSRCEFGALRALSVGSTVQPRIDAIIAERRAHLDALPA